MAQPMNPGNLPQAPTPNPNPHRRRWPLIAVIALLCTAIVFTTFVIGRHFGIGETATATTTVTTSATTPTTPATTAPDTTPATTTTALVATGQPPVPTDSVAIGTPLYPTAGGSTVAVVQQSVDSLAYTPLVAPDPNMQPVFPDVPYGNRPALVGYESPFEDGDFCDSTPCNMDVPQYYYRVMSAGQITIPDLGVDCVATDTKGCLVIVVNHYGETALYKGNVIDHGFTVAGRVWDMSTPDKVTLASQALVDHYVGRMLPFADGFNQGANCGTIDGCTSVEWHVVVIGNNNVQIHWTGLYSL